MVILYTKMPVIDEALIMVSYGAMNLIVIDDHSGGKTDEFSWLHAFITSTTSENTCIGNTEW
jgi:hypothetical protein